VVKKISKKHIFKRYVVKYTIWGLIYDNMKSNIRVES